MSFLLIAIFVEAYETLHFNNVSCAPKLYQVRIVKSETRKAIEIAFGLVLVNGLVKGTCSTIKC